MNNREQWLNTITNKYLRPHFASKGYTIPDNIRLSCSQSSKGIHTKKHQKRFTLGQCYPASMSSDNTTEIIIVPSLSDSVRVVDVLIHELCHATVGNKEGHNKVFADCAYAVGLEGKPTSTNATTYATSTNATRSLIMPLVTSENREQFIKSEMAKKAGNPVKKAEIDESKVKAFMKKYRKNEDKNYHSENAVELAKFLGHKEHEETAREILKRHKERGYLDDEDSNKRRMIEKELFPKVQKYYDQQ